MAYFVYLVGSDVFLGKMITVSFTSGSKHSMPTAHTCGCMLTMPIYASYNDVKAEFQSLLKSDYWIMDYA